MSNNDSLRTVILVQQPSEEKVDNLNQLSFNLYSQKPQEGKQAALQAISISNKIGYPKGLATGYRNKGICLHVMGDYSKALSSYKKALNIFSAQNDSSNISRTYSNIGLLFSYNQDYLKALEYYQYSIRFTSNQDTLTLLKVLNNMGLMHYKNKDLNKAKQYLNQAFKLCFRFDPQNIEMGSINGNMGLTYLELKLYPLAISHFQKAIDIYTQSNAQYHIAHAYSYMAMIYTKQHKHKLAGSYLSKAIDIQTQIRDNKGLIETLLKVVDLKISVKDYSAAKRYLNKVIRRCRKSNENKLLLSASQKKALIYAEEQDYRSAFSSIQNYVHLKDSLEEHYHQEQISKIETKYEVREKDVQITLLTQKRELDKFKLLRQRIFLILTSSLLLMAVVIIILFYLNFKIKRKRNQVLQSHNQLISAQKEELQLHKNNLENLVKERTSQLEIAKLKAEDSDRLKSAFLGNLSHEIRTPLNSIMGFSALVLDPLFKKEKKEEFSDMIAHNCNRLLRIIDDIMDISKLDSNQLELKMSLSDLDEILDELYDHFSDVLKRKNGSLVSLMKENTNSNKLYTVDSGRVNQILFNLLDNSCRFTHSGIIRYGIQVYEEQNQLTIFVEDTGEGVSKEYHEIIFEPFRAVDDKLNKIRSGNGLGLAIVSQLIKLMNGSIDFKSVPSRGTTVKCTIPFSISSEKEE